MNVLLIHQVFATPSQGGGTRHYELGRHLVANGHRFTIVAGNVGYLTGTTLGKPNDLISEEQVDGLRILRAYTYPSLHRSFVWRVVAFLSFMVTSVLAGLKAGKVDLVIGTTPPIFQAVSALLVARLRKRPLLLEVRDLWPEFAIDIGVLRNPILVQLSRWLERFLYVAADHILVNSPAYRDYLLEKGVSEGKISLIPNGVSPEMFDPERRGESYRARWCIEDKFVVMYAGALGLANDIPTILKAAVLLKENPRVHIVLVGGGKEKAFLERQATALGLRNVTFAGTQPKSAMVDVLAAADVCVATLQNIPMFATTYPNKVFDYMAAGRPTVLAIDGVIRRVVEAANGGIFVRPGDPAALALAVVALSTNEEAVATMGRRAREYVQVHFNRADQARDFEQMLLKIA